MSGGASLPRPRYPSSRRILWLTLLRYTRGPWLAVGFTLVTEPALRKAFAWFQGSVCASRDANDAVLLALNLDAEQCDRAWFVASVCLMHTTTYVLINSGFAALEKLGWLTRHKIPRTPSQETSTELMHRCWAQACFDHLVSPVLMWFVLYPLCKCTGMPSYDADLPGAVALYKTLAVAKIGYDWSHYWNHRVQHDLPSLYKLIHKQHHNFVGTVGFSAEFLSPLEQLFTGYPPLLVGPMMIGGAHAHVWLCWFAQQLHWGYETHSGFSFHDTFLYKIGLTYADDTRWHDFHHTANMGNFGAFYIDWLFGTCDAYEALGGHVGYFKKCVDKAHAAKAEGSSSRNENPAILTKVHSCVSLAGRLAKLPHRAERNKFAAHAL